MEQSSPKSNKEQDKSLVSLLGQLTDFKSELSNQEEDKIEEINIQNGDYFEKYINQKLKYQLKSDKAFSSVIDVSEVHDDMILSLNYALIQDPKDPQLNPETAVKIIELIDLVLKDETQIQIDSLLPLVEGKELFDFFNNIKEYSFPSDNKIDINKKYTVIVESTFCLQSQINIKANQLRKSYLVFSLIHDLYLKYPKYIKNYYKYFIKKYILKSKCEKKDCAKDDESIDLSSYGNYIFLIASNKTLKSFKETMESIGKSQYNEKESPDKDMNYLINNINKSKKFFAKIIYFDTYLNVITPKCEIMVKLIKMDEKMNMMEKDINKLKKTNKKLAEYISKIIPGFSLSDFDD